MVLPLVVLSLKVSHEQIPHTRKPQRQQNEDEDTRLGEQWETRRGKRREWETGVAGIIVFMYSLFLYVKPIVEVEGIGMGGKETGVRGGEDEGRSG